MALPVFDGHNDVLLADRSFLESSDDGHLDLARARAGGFAGGFFAIFTPHPDGFPDDAKRGPDVPPEPPVTHAHALASTLAGIGKLLALEADGALRIVRSEQDLELGGAVRAVMHIEGAEVLDPGLELLPALHALGLRSLGITWSRPNAFGHGVPFAQPSTPDTGPGLTDAGRALVRACEALGILVDLAHLNERGFWDVAQIAERPLVVTHACAHALVPSARNLTDAQLDAVRDSGGVVGVCFHHEDVGPHRTDIARQVDHIAARLGPEHVALGSDFDGCELPQGIAGAQDLPLVLDDLRALGWAEPELALVAHANFLRVLTAALAP
ncbi:MAG TPA: membrane dipeptidase [Solirubrobacteraceae bacterium]|nr:membrane dipeptidase [Solirubrobacteraceae bacterium]